MLVEADWTVGNGLLDPPVVAQAGGILCTWRTPLDWVDPTPAARGEVTVYVAVLPGGSWFWDGASEPPAPTW